MSLVLLPIDEVVTFDAPTHDPDTGGRHDADSAPTFDIFDGTNDTPILAAQTMTKRTGRTGLYRGTFTASAANGFVAGHSYNVDVIATVTGTVSLTAITSQWRALVFRCGPAENVAGVPRIDMNYILGTVSAGAAGSVRADQVTGAVGSVTGAVGSVTGNVGGNIVGSVASVSGNVGGNVNGNVAGTVASVVDLTTTATTELTSVPTSTATIRDMIRWVFLRNRNRTTQTSSTMLVKANDDATTVGTSTVSDDGTTAVRGKFS